MVEFHENRRSLITVFNYKISKKKKWFLPLYILVGGIDENK